MVIVAPCASWSMGWPVGVFTDRFSYYGTIITDRCLILKTIVEEHVSHTANNGRIGSSCIGRDG